MGLAGTGVILQPAACGLHSSTINAGVKQAILVEEVWVDLAVAPGEDTTLARNQVAELLGLPEAFHFAAGWATVTTSHLTEGISLDPALAKVINIGSHETAGSLEVIISVTII